MAFTPLISLFGVGNLRRILVCLFVVCSCYAESLHDQFRAAIGGADVVVIAWMHDMEAAGIKTEKVRFAGADAIEDLLARVRFKADAPEDDLPPLPDGAIRTTSNCLCLGTHVIRASRGDTLLTEISVHHATHLRSARINQGKDAYLTVESSAWLKVVIDWDREIQFLQNPQRKKLVPAPNER